MDSTPLMDNLGGLRGGDVEMETVKNEEISSDFTNEIPSGK